MVKGKTKNHIIIEKVGICRLIPSQSDEYIYVFAMQTVHNDCIHAKKTKKKVEELNLLSTSGV